MTTISIQSDFSGARRLLDRIRAEIQPKILAPAINKTVERGRVAMSRAIRSEYVLSAGRVNELLTTKKATAQTLSGEVRAKLRRGRRSLNLIEFLPATERNLLARSRGKQLRFKIRRTAGTVQIPGAFVGNQGRTVFRRVGPKRLPIEAVQTIDVGQMFNARKIRGPVERRMREQLVVEIERAIKSGRFG